jgi:hypothetical protein
MKLYSCVDGFPFPTSVYKKTAVYANPCPRVRPKRHTQTFKENPYFSNKTLTKAYKLHPEVAAQQGGKLEDKLAEFDPEEDLVSVVRARPFSPSTPSTPSPTNLSHMRTPGSRFLRQPKSTGNPRKRT